jgi:hypothetical protein
MLTEEAHHLFVGETGVGRTIEATCNAMKARHHRPYDKAAIRKLGVVDLPRCSEGQLPHVGHARPVRLGNLLQRRRGLQLGPEGPLQRKRS